MVLVEIWQWELDHIQLLVLGARGIVRQFLEEKPLIRAERPQGELRGTITRFNQAGMTHFCDVFVVLVPGDGVERQIGVLILDFERLCSGGAAPGCRVDATGNCLIRCTIEVGLFYCNSPLTP